jgi:hypothetical protein
MRCALKGYESPITIQTLYVQQASAANEGHDMEAFNQEPRNWANELEKSYHNRPTLRITTVLPPLFCRRRNDFLSPHPLSHHRCQYHRHHHSPVTVTQYARARGYLTGAPHKLGVVRRRSQNRGNCSDSLRPSELPMEPGVVLEQS